jgi:hypothetical protein
LEEDEKSATAFKQQAESLKMTNLETPISEAKEHRKELDALETVDPEFASYLKEFDKELLQFEESDEIPDNTTREKNLTVDMIQQWETSALNQVKMIV